MKKSAGIITAIMALFIMTIAAHAATIDNEVLSYLNRLHDIAGPQLLYPITHTIDLSDKDYLEFRWLDDLTQLDHYVFKIYKGYNMYASELIYKQNISERTTSYRIKSEYFKRGQVYTWSLVRVSIGGQKSNKSFSSFKLVESRVLKNPQLPPEQKTISISPSG